MMDFSSGTFGLELHAINANVGKISDVSLGRMNACLLILETGIQVTANDRVVLFLQSSLFREKNTTTQQQCQLK